MRGEALWSQASHFMEETVCWWRVCLCDLAPSPVPLCLDLAWFQSGWEGVVPVRQSAALMGLTAQEGRKGGQVLLKPGVRIPETGRSPAVSTGTSC